VAEPYKNPKDKRILQNIAKGSKGRMPYSWLYYDLVKNVSREKTFHSCQIPTGLSETLIKASTQPGDTVLILFGGSGSEIMVCKKLQRNFISAEINEEYHRLILERLANDGEVPLKYKLQLSKRTR
jgi:DNA modification methylase